MVALFKDELHEDFGTWPLAYLPYGGADFGEIEAVAEAVGDGDDAAYHAAWVAAGDRLRAEGEAALARGHTASARELYLRASAFYSTSYHPLYGAPTDPRLLSAFRRQIAAFDAGLALGQHPVRPSRIPFDGAELPAYLVPAQGRESEVRPLIVFVGGYDSTVTDSYFAAAVAASRRGYHTLLVDGPGQGAVLYEQGVPIRPDWESVIGAVIDFAVAQPIVDPARIALSGWSLGGYLAPRAASGEPRAASGEPRVSAVIADPGTWSIADGFRDAATRLFGVPAQAAADLGALPQPLLDRIEAAIRADRALNWKVVRRGFWVHGVATLRDYLAASELFTMRGRAELIRCPTLITMAEGDGLSARAEAFFEALRCPRTLLRFAAAEGAGGHCEMRNRSLLNRRVLDWLDEVFAG